MKLADCRRGTYPPMRASVCVRSSRGFVMPTAPSTRWLSPAAHIYMYRRHLRFLSRDSRGQEQIMGGVIERQIVHFLIDLIRFRKNYF